MKVLALTRAPQFSPNSVDNDRAILMAVVERLRNRGCEVTVLQEGTALVGCEDTEAPDAVLTMGRLPETLAWLNKQRCTVINSAESVERCARSTLHSLMIQNAIPIPPEEGSCGYWLKRGDACAQSPHDVVYCKDISQLEAEKKAFQKRSITDYVVSAHVEGDLVKFYGVASPNAMFFRYFYPTDDGQSKYGDERRNGPARHYTFEEGALRHDVERLARLTGLAVYGGDAIIRPDGTYCIIDFNDWPSFSRCREEAADAIASLLNLS